MEKLNMQTTNIVDENIKRIGEIFSQLRDSSLANDQVADNFEQIWEEYSKDTVRRIL